MVPGRGSCTASVDAGGVQRRARVRGPWVRVARRGRAGLASTTVLAGRGSRDSGVSAVASEEVDVNIAGGTPANSAGSEPSSIRTIRESSARRIFQGPVR